MSSSFIIRFGINRDLLSFNQENEYRRLPFIISQLHEGKSVALVSDAGTPVLSDPGSPLVKVCLEQTVPVTPIPGANAAVSALICSGFYSTPFSFYGFISRSGKSRSAVFVAWSGFSLVWRRLRRISTVPSCMSLPIAWLRRCTSCRPILKQIGECASVEN